MSVDDLAKKSDCPYIAMLNCQRVRRFQGCQSHVWKRCLRSPDLGSFPVFIPQYHRLVGRYKSSKHISHDLCMCANIKTCKGLTHPFGTIRKPERR